MLLILMLPSVVVVSGAEKSAVVRNAKRLKHEKCKVL